MANRYIVRFTGVLVALILLSCDPSADGNPTEAPSLEEFMAEADALHEELMGRLTDHGVTLAELDAVARLGDEDAVQDLFGMTDEEMRAAHERIVALEEMAEGLDLDARPTGIAPAAFTCDVPGRTACVAQALALAKRLPWKLKLPVLAVWQAGCNIVFCRRGDNR